MYTDMPKNTARGSGKIAFLLLLISVALLFSNGQAYGLTVNYLSSFPTNNGDPIRVASDRDGVLYVTCPSSGKVLEFAQDGTPLGSLEGFKKPMSVAVDSAYRVYVGDFKDGSVTVMSLAGQSLFSLGSGKGEFGIPGDIAIASNGLIYVTDSQNNIVKVYAADGSFQFSFGSAGTLPGQMRFPTGITSDNSNQEIYVVDHNNGRIEVFGFDGTFKRSFASYGSGQGRLTRPQGIQVSNGYVYVTDAYQSSISIFTTTGTFAGFIGQFGSGPGQLKVPMDVAMVGTTLFVANNDNERIEVFDIVDPQGLALTPSALSFTATLNTTPSGQDIMVDSEVPNTNPPVQWTASAEGSFIQLGSTAGTTGAAPVAVSVNVNTAGLSVGTYTGAVIFHSLGNNTDYPVTVTLTVSPPPQELIVAPASLSLTNKDGNATSQTVSVGTNWGSLSWSATADVSWLSLSATSGATPGSITASLNQSIISGLADGTYDGTITVTASNVIGSPAKIPVTLVVEQQRLSVSSSGLNLSYKNGVMTSDVASLSANWGSLSWSATADVAWLSLSATSGTTPGSITASLDQSVVNGLGNGTYSGTVTITAANAAGSPAKIPVTLVVEQQRLLVSPAVVDMVHQLGGELASSSLSVLSNSGSLQWTASTDVQWLALSLSAAATPSALTVALTQNADQLSEGIHNATITLTANAVNSPVVVPVTLKVVVAGNIVVNVENAELDTASFTITGTALDGTAVTYSGSGKSWSTDEAKPGNYNLKFDYIKGYRKPASASFEVGSGKTVTFNVQYRPLPVANVIVAAKGPHARNNATVRVLDLNGSLVSEFLALPTKFGARVATGDINGDGVDEIIVAPGRQEENRGYVKVFRSDGSALTEIAPLAHTHYGAEVAAGDIDGDGKAEIAVSVSNGARTVIIYGYDGSALVEKVRIPLGGHSSNYPANIAFGDLMGDGRLNLITAASGKISVYTFNSDMTSASLTASRTLVTGDEEDDDHDNKKLLTISAGDINGDGVDEVIIGYVGSGRNKGSLVSVLNGDLTDSGLSFAAFARGESSPTVSSMDSDGDSLADILAGAGSDSDNDAILRLFDSSGVQVKEIKAFDNSRSGVNAAFGVRK